MKAATTAGLVAALLLVALGVGRLGPDRPSTAGAATTTADTTTTDTTTTDTTTAAAPRLLDVSDLRLPVQQYMLDDTQLGRIALARVLLVRRCLLRYGVSTPRPAPPSARYGPRTLTDRRYGITDAALAARYGFGLGPRDPARQLRPATPELDPDGQTALTGQGRSVIAGRRVPAGGCLGRSDRELDAGAPPGADADLAQRVQFSSFEASRSDPRVRAVFDAWSRCVAARGPSYTDPLASASDPRFSGPGAAGREAIRVALLDIDCKRRTNLVGVWFTVESRIQAALIHREQPAFDRSRAALRARAGAAASVLARPDG